MIEISSDDESDSACLSDLDDGRSCKSLESGNVAGTGTSKFLTYEWTIILTLLRRKQCRRYAFINKGPDMVDFLIEQGFKWSPKPSLFPEYHPEIKGAWDLAAVP